MDLVLYITIENNITDIDRFITVGFHGYIFDKIVEKNTKKPSKFETTNNGYYAKTDLKRTKSKIVEPIYFLDGYRRLNYNYYDSIVKVLSSIARFKKRYNINRIVIKTNNVELGKLLKTKDEDLELIFDGYLKKNITYIRELKTFVNSKIIRVYDGSIGLECAKEADIIHHNTKKDIFIKLSNIKYYWTPEKRKVKTKGDFIMAKHLIFKNVYKDNIPYCFCNYKKDDNVGLQTNYVAYYQYYTKDGLSDINYIRKLFNNMLDDLEVICTIDTETFYEKSTERLKLIYDNDYLITDIKNKCVIKKPDGTIIASEIKPVGIAGHGMNNCNILATIMRSFVRYINNKPTLHTFKEFTDVIYENGKIRKEVDNKYKVISIVSDEIIRGIKSNNVYKLKFIAGIDYPDRNTLKRIEKSNPKLYTCFNKINDKVFEYYNIIFVEDTDEIIVWSNIYSNKLPFKHIKKR